MLAAEVSAIFSTESILFVGDDGGLNAYPAWS
jgi:hypothetical protein